MKHWSQIAGTKDNPQEYTKIVRTADRYIVFIEEDGQEVPLVSFTSNQIGSAVCISANKTDQHVWYNNDSSPRGLTRCSVGLWLSGPHELMRSLMKGTMEVSAA